MEFLKSKTVLLEDNAAKPWSEETKVKVEKIIEILSGKEISTAKNKINESRTSTTSSSSVVDSDLDDDNSYDLDDFCGSEDDE